MAPAYGDPAVRFAVVVLAHDEEAGIAATVTNLPATDYPRDRVSVNVVSDNCSDQTGALAAAAGARALTRTNQELRGKGYAVAYAFEELAAEVDAFVIVDAETLVSQNLLRA